LLVAAQAAELRNSPPLGGGNERLLQQIRASIPRTAENGPVPSELDCLISLIRSRPR
jgi:hypothetical protein